ncbi:MAG: DUF523 domain-containing protein [Desulfobulbaceae bacterium]|nr:MAG: DUF523 domain-containing protein [Desulfobulbaceae bacterium]
MKQKETVLVSACLVGLCTRYDAQVIENSACMSRLNRFQWVPFCPEQLGGMPTPRTAADIVGGTGVDVLEKRAKVIDKNGTDVSLLFIKGAEQTLLLAKKLNIKRAILKARSPSCGVNKQGVTAALLARNNFILEEF